jgi:hypothetical protein
VKLNKHILTFLLLLLFYACSKTPEFKETDPDTGEETTELTPPGGNCYIAKIAQKNKSSSAHDNAFIITRDAAFLPTKIGYYDSLTGKTDYEITIEVKGDTLKLNTGEYLVINSTTKQVLTLSTKSDIKDPLSDDMLYSYSYDAAGLLEKKLVYVNGSATATYQSEYTYDNNAQLTGCTLYAGNPKQKYFESTLEYDYPQAIKPWFYLFPDFFEGYHYLQAFNFGKRPVYQVKRITSRIYDVGTTTVLDTWTTNLAGYVTSKDKFVLQVTASGDLQQGLGFLYGTTRFNYTCSK